MLQYFALVLLTLCPGRVVKMIAELFLLCHFWVVVRDDTLLCPSIFLSPSLVVLMLYDCIKRCVTCY